MFFCMGPAVAARAKRPTGVSGRAANSSGENQACSVTSSPHIMMGIPDENTISAASGSAWMLNSEQGVRLPPTAAPP